MKASVTLLVNQITVLFNLPVTHHLIGANTYEGASDYVLNRFLSLNQSDTKQIYTHLTCATDTEQIKFVMAAVNDIIIQNNLRDVGLL